MTEQEREQKISRLARRVWKLAGDRIVMHRRFLSVALFSLRLREKKGLGCTALQSAPEGMQVWYDPETLLRGCREAPQSVSRLYLHLLFHCIFAHGFSCDRMDRELWDLAADIAAEQAALQLRVPGTEMERDEEAAGALRVLREEIGTLTAERIYRHFRQHTPGAPTRERYARLFARDDHRFWGAQETLELSRKDWQKISERVRADLNSFSAGKTGEGGDEESIAENLREAVRERCSYEALLRRFVVTGEEMRLSAEEFDYVYYTYGLSTYGDLPFVEPLEYRDEKKVREFVIALDTSASCRDGLVRGFLKKTYAIFRDGESFFRKMNLHIIQCDNQVRQDAKITSREEFDRFLREGKLTGFGSTDFRPVFDYVDQLCRDGELENLKGLIYFTDGYGIYPERMPDYDVIFAFLQDDARAPEPPPWAARVVLEEEELLREDEPGRQGKETQRL